MSESADLPPAWPLRRDSARREIEGTAVMRRGRLCLEQLSERLQEVRLPAGREHVARDRHGEMALYVPDREAGEQRLEVGDELTHAVGLPRRWGCRKRSRGGQRACGDRDEHGDDSFHDLFLLWVFLAPLPHSAEVIATTTRRRRRA